MPPCGLAPGRVIPGGMYGHLNVARLPPGYPQFFARAEGAALWDVDGNDYVDFMCAYGPMVLGYGNREVEAAADAQRELGDVLTGPSERLVELAEKLVGMVAHADWALFQKNGTDATTLCVVIARAATSKRKILVGARRLSRLRALVHAASHGDDDRGPRPSRALRLQRRRQPGRGRQSAEGDIAGVIVSAFKHDYGKDQEMPTPAFAQAVRKLCDEAGAALILDDVRAGFRLHLGGSWETVGVRPDLAAYSKAIANGYTLAAVTGSDRLRDAAASVFMTGSFWCGAVSMAAALKTLEIFERDDSIATMARLGQRLRDGLDGAGQGQRPRAAPDRSGADAEGAVRRRCRCREGPAVRAPRRCAAAPGSIRSTTCSCRPPTPRPTSTARCRRPMARWRWCARLRPRLEAY